MADAEKQQPERPINDPFWFKLSKEWVQQSISNLDGSAAKLQTVMGWLWGVYTAGATVGIALSKLSYPLWVNILIALPSVFLILGYWLAGLAQMPEELELKESEEEGIGKYKFDPRAPKEIKAVYMNKVNTRRRRLSVALLVSFVAAMLVAVALFAASFSHQATTPNFQAYLHTQDGRDTIALSGHLPADTNILVKISSSQEADVVLEELPYVTSSSGELQASITLDSVMPGYDVTVGWEEKDGMVHSLQRTVLPQK